ncbi:hypothetical protein A2Z22_01385 [Candidatus Woesebacteria bacterium RBG_16_34_12]|uniref:Uncharacterized protein n=1 Tax=Candidatus Woesebacteria bacterium RBG_16_34_12 TaxID=1802480 RepID=A0A1F7X9Z2_9BACT|nr:MAG: hypothetical protein A2Z22_01385 [Candidatus Woesebacteria bacterium RBG_16_34_12]
MSKRIFVLIVFLLILALFLTTPRALLFYDAPEYVDIVSNNGLIDSMMKVHHPIRPFFMLIFWIIFRIHRERIDYGYLLTRIWVFLTNRHEPLTWTYADRDGFFIFPVDKKDINSIYFKKI